jgi:hypothetical protein
VKESDPTLQRKLWSIHKAETSLEDKYLKKRTEEWKGSKNKKWV